MLPTGTVTFLFTDIEGSTRLLRELGPDAYSEALAEHRRVLRETFAANGGVEVDTQGDAFLVAFPTVQGAANAAMAGGEALADGPIRVRIGLHTGTPKLTGEGYIGIDVHRGARVGALAHGGQTVVSPTTAAFLDGEPLRDLGLHRLKDFEGATRLHQLGEGEFPPLRTPGSVDLPTPATRFLGRERELFEAISLAVDRDPRVLTIVGPGGTGKTRFAIELARLLAEEADGATLFVALAPLRDGTLVLPTIADRLGAPSPEPHGLAAATGGRRTHLVLDNAEHLLPAAAPGIAELVAAAPSLRLLVTSREPLRIQGEHQFDLAPLFGDEAVALFVERARAVRPDTAPTPAIGELCERLDRLPLALELAAARTKLLAPEALLERLGQRLDLLRGTRDADERHATLRTTIAWSYDLLDEAERTLFARLSVFAAGCTLESAEQVTEAELDTLESLLDKSLLRRRTGQVGEERVWMLETIREFAAERLDGSPDADVTRRRHAERMLAIARSAHLTEEDDEPFQLPLVLAERDDMRAALDWASDNDVELALELLVSLENFWNSHAPEEVLRRLDRLLLRADEISPALRASALRVRGGALHVFGDFESCDPPYQESLALFRDLADERGMAQLTERLANSASQRGELERAQRARRGVLGAFARAVPVHRGCQLLLARPAPRADRRRRRRHGPHSEERGHGGRPALGLVASKLPRAARVPRARSRRPRRGRARRPRSAATSPADRESSGHVHVTHGTGSCRVGARTASTRRSPLGRGRGRTGPRAVSGLGAQARRARRTATARDGSSVRRRRPGGTAARCLGRRRDRAWRGRERNQPLTEGH